MRTVRVFFPFTLSRPSFVKPPVLGGRMNESIGDFATLIDRIGGAFDEAAAQREIDCRLKFFAAGELELLYERAATALSNAGHDVELVGEIVDIICVIAEPTNILAMNAAIETTRNGEVFSAIVREAKVRSGGAGKPTEPREKHGSV